MIDMHSKYDNMHRNGMFDTLICINNHIIACVSCMLLISNYSKRITLSYPSHMVSMVDLLAISVEKPKINSGCSLEKEFAKLICMNP